MDGLVMVFTTLASGLGGWCRFAIGHVFPCQPGSFPWATFAINTTGSMAAALALGFVGPGGEFLYQVVLFGFLGGYTTVSTFSLETLVLLQNNRVSLALANVSGSAMACLGAAWLGLALAG